MNIKKLQQKMTKITINFVLFVMVFGVAFNTLPQPYLNQNGKLSFEPALNPAYASIAYVGGTSGTGASASYAVDLTGLGLSEGDLVIVVNGYSATANGNPGVTTSGYTEISDLYADDVYDMNMSVNWKIMGASPDTSVTCSGSGSATNASVCLVYAWSGVDSPSPMDITETETTGTNASVPNGPSITPVTNGATVVVAGMGTGVDVDTSVTAPSGYSNQVSSTSDPGLAVVGAIVSKAWTSGSEDPAAWTNWTTAAQDSWAAVTMVLRPLVPTWNATDWTLYDTITIDATQVDATLTDFPVYVDLADLSSQFWSTTPTGATTVGTDIRVTTDDGSPVELPRELVAASSTAQTGELHFKANSISSTTDTVFRIYYNGTTTGDYTTDNTYGAENVWSNGYVAVYHLNEEGNNSVAGYRDSTQFANHGTGTSMTAASDVAGVLGNGQDFDGVADYIKTKGSASLGYAGESSMSVWVNATGTTRKIVMLEHDGSGADSYDIGKLQFNGAGTFGYQVQTGNGATYPTASGGTPSDNTWYYLTGVMTTSGATNTINLYQDGVYQGSNSVNPVVTNQSSHLAIGATTNTSQFMDGLVDEVRVASTSRSAAWIKAEYTNQATTTDFYTAALSVDRAISGTLYSDEGTTPITTGKDLVLVVGTSTPSSHTATTNGSGVFTFTLNNSQAIDGTPYTLYINGETEKASLFNTFAAATNTTGINLYQNHTIFRDDAGSGLDISDIATYDYTHDTDILTNASSTASTLEVISGATAYVWTGDTLNGAASSTFNGSFDNNGTYLAGATTTFTGSAKTISGTLTTTSSFQNVVINGSYTFSDNASTSNLTINASASLTAPTTLTIDGDFTQNGTFTNTSGTVQVPSGALYDISQATFDSIALSVAGQETNPTDMLFNNDGTILYVMGTAGQDINAYPLPTPYDIASYTSGTSIALSVAAQEGGPTDMLFNNDGTILYVMGTTGDDINAYPLPTPYDIASYTSGTSIALSVAGQETWPYAMLFNDDGTILYVMGTMGDDINAYPLPTPYDIASYTSGTSIALSVAAQEDGPVAMLFNNDGTILYVMGLIGQDINAYPLPTPYDIASYTSGTSIALSVAGQETYPTDMLFNNDGTILYVMGLTGQDINAYNVPTHTYSGTLTGSSALNNFEVLSDGAVTLTTPVSLTGDFQNSGAYIQTSGTTTFSGTSGQTATGTLTFNKLAITNTSGSAGAPSVVFGNTLTTTGIFTMDAGSSAAFAANKTATFADVDWSGTVSSPIYLRSTSAGTQWDAALSAQSSLTYVDVKDSDGSPSAPIVVTNFIDSGNNINWYDSSVSISSTTFSASTTNTSWVVPAGVTSITVDAWGGGGGGGGGGTVGVGGAGAGGGYIGSTISVTPGETLTIRVGGRGIKGDFSTGTGGANSGDGGGGGGYTAILRGSQILALAGGGGGGGGGDQSSATAGGAGGAGGGSTGDSGSASSLAGGGAGGSQTSGGAGGTGGTNSGTAGAALAGGDGGKGDDAATGSGGMTNGGTNGGGNAGKGDDGCNGCGGGAGGGAGYYGGGGGASSAAGDAGGGGGGGGSSYATSTATATTTSSGSGRFAGNNSDYNYNSTAGIGGTGGALSGSGSDGNDGLLVISYTYVPASTWNQTSWTLYDTITIDADKVDATLTDFPVYVDLSDLSSQFWATTPTSTSYVGTDIRVTTDGGSPVELPRELVAASSTTQTGELHFKANSISSTTDTVFRVYYNGTTTGDYQADDTYGAENVWTNGYVGVWHLGEGDSTATNFYKDSTSNNYDGSLTDSNSNTNASTGKFGGAMDFNGDADFILTNVPWNTTESDVTVSLWTKAVTGGGANDTFGAISGSERLSAQSPYSTTVYWDYGTCCSTGRATTTYTGYFDKWTYQNFVYQSSPTVLRGIYLDGILQSSNATADEPNVNFSTFYIGGIDGAANYFDGEMDDLRLSSSARSAAWIKAEYINQATTTDFYNTAAAVLGSSTISNHVAGQVSNKFSSQNKTNEALFAFKLTPNSGNATTTQLELEVSGYSYQKLNTTDFTNIRLYRDMDNDAAYDATDIQVGGSGTFSLWSQNNQYGTIVFTEDFLATTSQNFVVVADWNAPANGSYMTIGLVSGGLDMQDNVGAVTVDGSVSSIQHNRYRSGGGGSSAQIGGDAPAGDGDVGGGGQTGGGQIDTNTGGNTIGGSPDFYWPTAQSGSWNNGANAIDQVDGTYATTSSSANHEFTDYNDSVPGSDTINGIEVKLELSGTTAAGYVGVQLSWNGGTNWTTAKNTPTLTTTDDVVSVGGASDTWGRSWSVGEFSNSNFRVRLIGNPSTNEIRVDALQVKIYHQSSGGGSGGGGGGGAI